jgi:hypothetical protein
MRILTNQWTPCGKMGAAIKNWPEMSAEPSSIIDQALRQPAPAGSSPVQLALLPGDAAKGVLGRQASAELAPAAGKAGRPPGSSNRFSRDLARLITLKLGRHPLEELLDLYQRPLVELQAAFAAKSLHDAGAIKERLLFKLVEATTPKQAQVKVDVENKLHVVFGDLGDAVPEAFDDDDDIIEVEANDNNDLGGSAG